ncbi:MAG: thiamine pyrophosphate-dependent dehydrogenase E1 component subunit alpha [Egibacteraceae bacterium]
MELSRSTALDMYERMALIRTFEDRASKLFAQGELPGFVHLYAGEEAVAVGVCAHLDDRDAITSTHRGHGHCIAKGVDVQSMMAELYGRATGACRGKGGSMHIADVDKGMLGANGIVGGGPPLATGAALAAKLLGTGGVAVCFFGDGAAEQGTTHEGMNLAAIWELPIVFVCENNGFAESTPAEYHASVADIAERANAYGMPGVTIDGLDVVAVYEAVDEAVRRARDGQGPSLIEAQTWRYYGHFEGDPLTYRTKEQDAEVRTHDPIAQFAAKLEATGIAERGDLEVIDARCRQAVDDAVAFAKESPYPEAAALLEDVYVSYEG